MPQAAASDGIELSIVMPCLNEADTLGTCIEKAQRAMDHHGIAGEIVVADNGSTDASAAIAENLGARVVPVPTPGYGAALMGGINAARGRYVIMGDADDSYDFLDIFKFVKALRDGCDIVQGCRFPSGGGKIMPGAMPLLHRYWGNPMFSALARVWFGAPVHDIYCGLRGFRKEWYETLDQRSTGMTFATEMIVKATLTHAKITEVPITLHQDGRKAHPPHLKTFRDGWRTLTFLLMYTPRWLFLIPGLLVILLGALGYGLALPGVTIGGATFDAHTLLFSSVAIICGYQAILFSILAQTFSVNAGLMPETSFYQRFYGVLNLERGLILALLVTLGGVCLLGSAVITWWSADFGRLDYADTMRVVIPGATLTAIGFETLLASFFASILGMKRL